MGHLSRVCLGVTLITFAGVARAEPAPQWSDPQPPTALPAAPARPPQPASPAPASPAPAAPAPASPAPASPAPASPAPVAQPAAAPPPPVAVPYPYPQSYAYPPPGYEFYFPTPPKPTFPSNAAVRSTPFLEAVVVGVNWENRLSEFLNVGAQAGLFVADRLRLSARIAFPTDNVRDDYYSGSSYTGQRRASKSMSLLYGGSAGVVAVSSSSFAMSPGLALARTDVADYGSMVAFSMPFDWVLSSGVRVGVEVDFGRTFGGQYAAADCSTGVCGPFQTHDRPAGTAFWLQFQFGFGFNHPAPLQPVSAPAAAPAAR